MNRQQNQTSNPPTDQQQLAVQSPKKKNKADKLNKPSSLPPGVEGDSYGSLFIEIASMDWFVYNGINYIEDSGGEFKPIQNLFVNIKFWGETAKGIYLRCANGMRKGEKNSNKFRYDIRCPEKTFEKYLDDMGVLIVDFFDTQLNQTVGTSKIMMKLYIKRAKKEDDQGPLLELRGSFPITLTGNQNIKIGEFNIALISSFPVAHRSQDPENMNSALNDSFIDNEKRAQQMTQQEKNKQINELIFQDDRIPSSLQGKRQPEDYKTANFLNKPDLPDERPIRGPSKKPINLGGKENQRNQINIDENEDTFHNSDQLANILARGQKLREQMDQALDQDEAWNALHGPHIVPKKYVPPFLKPDPEKKDEMDRLYELEFDGIDPNHAEYVAQQSQQQAEDKFSQNPNQNQDAGHISEMKFIKVKLLSLRIENEELLHQLIDQTFTLIVEVPLPDVYQKRIAFQQIKVSNYDVVSFNEFAYNNSSLYNFKVDEETFNKMVTSTMKVSIEGLPVTGNLSMIKLLMAKNYKLQISIPLERSIKIDDPMSGVISPKQTDKKKDPKKGGKAQLAKKAGPPPASTLANQAAPQFYTHHVGTLNVELQLQKADAEDEIARDYQLKLQKLQEQRAKEEEEKTQQMQKYLKYTNPQEPTFAQIYLHISQIRDLCLNTDGTLIEQSQQQQQQQVDELNQRTTSVKVGEILLEEEQKQQIKSAPKRNLYVSFKAFPSQEKLKTSIAWQERDPKFVFRSQFPLIVNPDTIQKLQNFTFIFEVWDHVQPSREDFLGLVRVPLSSFCQSMRTTDSQIFSLNFLSDSCCNYPMLISDGPLPIYSPRHGKNIGDLYLTLALGSPIQVSRQIQKEQEVERQQTELEMRNKIEEALRKGQSNALSELPKIQVESVQQPPPETVPQPIPQQSLSPKVASNPFFSRLQNNDGGEQNDLFKSLGNFFKQSINVNSSMGRDVDMRKLTYLNCLRKLFEEARAADYQEINGESDIFREMPKNYDGTIKKDDFIYAIMSCKHFTLTRTEISNISALIVITQSGPNPKSSDGNSIDLEELQRSFRSYLTYYDSIEARIKDLLEKFMLSVQKKIEDEEEYENFVKQIENKADESKIATTDLRDIFDNNGIFIRDALYDQLSSYFDLDRNDHIYITSFCEFLKNPRMTNFNFFKVHPIIVVNLVSEYIKNEVQLRENTLSLLEDELKQQFFQKQAVYQEDLDEFGNQKEQKNIPEDILVQERISSKLFQGLIRKYGVQLSDWEIYTLFDNLNTTYMRMYYEPQRYHQMTFPPFYRFITGQDYEAKLRQDAIKREHLAKEEEMKRQFEQQQQELMQQHQQRLNEQNPLLKASLESAFELAADLNNKRKNQNESDGIYSSKSYDQISERPDESEDVVIKKKKKRKEMTFADKVKPDGDDSSGSSITGKSKEPAVDNRPYRKVKHIFEIQVKELKNIPLIDKLIKDLSAVESAKIQHSRSPHLNKKGAEKNRYIQNVAVKYSFPLDEDEIFQSDFLQLNADSLNENNQYDYKVSINTVHNYVMNKEEHLQKLLKTSSAHGDQSTALFNLSLVMYDSSKEYVIGNAQLPIEDLIDVVENYNSHIVEGKLPQKQTLSRILFIYGTSYSERDNMIIGKMQVEINYHLEKQFEASLPETAILDPSLETNPSCFLHRETFIKRKIPLNAVLSVEIERINNLKESLENIEHFAKIQNRDDKHATSSNKTGGMSGTHISKNHTVIQSREQTDRRRILTQIFKQGLNLIVIGSIFDEDQDLKRKMPMSKHTTRMLFNTLTPIFNEGFEIGIQMDTLIFEYLKNKKAIFEVRHYILDPERLQKQGPMQTKSDSSVSHRSYNTEENEEREMMHESDFIVLGYVRVPLLHLITKNNGIDGDFVIFDDFKQQMGSLKLRIALNHHSSKRPLYSDTNKVPQPSSLNAIEEKGTMIDRSVKLTQTLVRNSMSGPLRNQAEQSYLLGLNFVELIFKNRNQSKYFSSSDSQNSFMYLKFRLLGQNYQTKFVSSQNQSSVYLQQLNINVLDIKKTVFIELDFLNQSEIEEAFSKPLEVQLWLKKDHAQRHHQPEVETQIGSFFIELNDLGKIKNRRIKAQNGIIQGYEGYFSLYDYQKDQVVPDRLGCKIMMLKKGKKFKNSFLIEYVSQISDLEVLFHNLAPLENSITTTLDPQCKGYVDLDDLIQEAQKSLQDPYQSILKSFIGNLEYKNSDKVYYSPLFGELPPFFRYAKRFEAFGVIEKFAKELSSIDTHMTGFVPLNLFRSILEHELKIKEKIVLDFIHTLRETDQSQQLQSMDVNMFSHSFRSHIDYVILLRKLAFYYDLRQSSDQSDERSARNMSTIQVQSQPDQEEVTLRIDIESAIRLKNPENELDPPNSYVVLNLPYQGCLPKKLQTHIIHKSSYPAWHQVNQQVKFSLTNEILRHIIDYPLEFEVYHQSKGLRDSQSIQQIGVAYVDLSQMVFIDGVYQIGGYFHVVRKDRFKNGQTLSFADPHRLSMESLGQIKLGVTSNTNLKRAISANPNTHSLVRSLSPENKIMEAQVQHNERFQNDESNYASFNPFPLPSSTKLMLEQSLKQAGLNLQDKHSNELKMTLQAKMSELDELNKNMRMKTQFNKSPEREQPQLGRDPYQSSFAMTMGHEQSAELRNSFQPFAYQPFRAGQQHQAQFTAYELQPINEYNRGEDEDSFKRDNIFENNISQSSNQEQYELQAQRQQQETIALNNELLRQQQQDVLGGTFNQDQFQGFNQVLDAQNQTLTINNLQGNIFTDNQLPPPQLLQRSVKTESDDLDHSAFQRQQEVNDQDEEEKELKRIEKILKQTVRKPQ